VSVRACAAALEIAKLAAAAPNKTLRRTGFIAATEKYSG
jgi:hypothetical protein